MINRKEFRKYAMSNHGISGTVIDDVISHVYGAENMTRTVIEERNMPFREVDVFSRLMADRIIFLGTEIDDYIANIIQAQLLFLESADAKKDIQIYINSPGGARGQASDIEITAREIQKLKKELYDIISHHSGKPYDQVWADSDRDYWMIASEAKEYGMIDEVLDKKKA